MSIPVGGDQSPAYSSLRLPRDENRTTTCAECGRMFTSGPQKHFFCFTPQELKEVKKKNSQPDIYTKMSYPRFPLIEKEKNSPLQLPTARQKSHKLLQIDPPTPRQEDLLADCSLNPLTPRREDLPTPRRESR